jgi:hypothetical protein
VGKGGRMKIIRIEKCGECPYMFVGKDFCKCEKNYNIVLATTMHPECPLENMPPIDWDKVAEDEFWKNLPEDDEEVGEDVRRPLDMVQSAVVYS